MAVFLASGETDFNCLGLPCISHSKDDSSYVNGQNIAVDGGLTASLPVIPGRWA